MQRIIQLLQIVLPIVFQFDAAFAFTGDDTHLAAKAGSQFLFTFSQIIDPRRLLLDGLRLLGKLFAKRLRLPDGKTQRHDLLRDGQLLHLILDGQQRPRVTGGQGTSLDQFQHSRAEAQSRSAFATAGRDLPTRAAACSCVIS